MYISASVGQNGKNKKAEVAFIQALLALLAEEDLRMPVIVSDGVCGKNTIAAMGKFQSTAFQKRIIRRKILWIFLTVVFWPAAGRVSKSL